MVYEFGVINVWTYIVGVIFIILVPGPNSIFVLTTSVRKGVKSGYQAALGVFLGDAILMFCAFIGVASLIQASPILFTIIKYAGAAYLFYLGVKILYSTLIKDSALEIGEIGVNRASPFKKAMLLSITNPKAILFFVSFFVQFFDPNYPITAIPFLILACILEFCSFIYLSFLIIFGAALAARFRERSSLSRVGNSVVGSLFVGFGIKLMIA